MLYPPDTTRSLPRVTRPARRSLSAVVSLLLATAGCHSSFQPFPDALACAGATVRTVGLDADSAGITHLSNLNDVVWYGWKNGTKSYYVTYHGSTTAELLPADGTPRGINAAGVVVERTATGPLVYDHGTVTRIPVPSSWSVLAPTSYSGNSGWVPIGINDSGYVAMKALATPTREIALFWRNGAAPTGISWTEASSPEGFNNANTVLTNRPPISLQANGLLWELHFRDGTILPIDGAISIAINDLGHVAYATMPATTPIGALRNPDGTTQALAFTPTGLNNNLQMIGTGFGAQLYAAGSAYVRLDHALDNLNVVITQAVAINNNGTIAANAMDGTVKHQVGVLFNASACTLK